MNGLKIASANDDDQMMAEKKQMKKSPFLKLKPLISILYIYIFFL